MPEGAEADVDVGFLAMLFVATAIALLGWALNGGSRRGSIDPMQDQAPPDAGDHQPMR